MTTLIPEEWQRLRGYLDTLLDTPVEARPRRLAALALPPHLHEELSELLAAADTEDFLEQTAASMVTPASSEVEERLEAGARIGAYRIERLLGRGGMGEVYLAQRGDGLYRQKVAVKVLRAEAAGQWPRFDAERQILALMEHPGIARLLDGGISDSGRPYTVVEYVEGSGLLHWCKTAEADLQQRLALFLQACDAVIYAHAHLVIHRDLKPGNLMVTLEGRVKLLDFGVAKLLDANTLRTGSQTLFAPFTPDYAAPEQIEGKPITTATDVYSLGVVLFELLTGRRPRSMRELPLALAVQRLLHQAPPAASASAAANPEAPLASRQLLGDLDAIVDKALRAEPEHRYATVEAFAADLRRHLRGEPVEAREGARLYVTGRFLRRHRWGVAGALMAVVMLITAAAGYGLWRERLADARLRQTLQDLQGADAMNDFLALMFRSAADGAAPPEGGIRAVLEASAARVVEQYRGQPQALAQVVLRLADLFTAAEDTESIAPMLERYLALADARTDPADLARAKYHLVTVELRRGNIDRAELLLDQALSFWRSQPARYKPQLTLGRVNQAEIQRARGDLDGAIRTLREGLALSGGASATDRSSRLVIYQNLAGALAAANRPDESLEVYEQGWREFEAAAQTRTPTALTFLGSWAVLATNRGLMAEAEARYRESIALRRQLYGESLQLAASLNGLGRVLGLLGRGDEALPMLRQAQEMAQRYGGARTIVAIAAQLFAADVYLLQGDRRAAASALASARADVVAQFGAGHLLALRVDEAQARLLLADGKPEQALRLLAATETRLRAAGGGAAAALSQTLLTRGRILLTQGQAGAALAPLRESLALRERQTAQNTWPRAEVQSVLGAALAATGDAQGRALQAQAQQVLEAQLGTDHPLLRQGRP